MLLSSCARFALLFFSCFLCRGLPFATVVLPQEQSWSSTDQAQRGCTGCKVTPTLDFLFPNLGHKYNFQVARVRFPFHAHTMLPFPPQVTISQVSFYLGYCEMPILPLGKNSNLNVCSADADSGCCQLQVEQDHHSARESLHFGFSGP